MIQQDKNVLNNKGGAKYIQNEWFEGYGTYVNTPAEKLLGHT
jgi:hypothetical protein